MKRMLIYLLTLGVFLTATSELVVAGILNVIAGEMGISVALAGQLITAYSLAFAIGTPILVSLTSRVGRKKMLIASLSVFILGCLISFGSFNFTLLLVSRIILGLSAGVYLVVTFGSVSKLVPVEKIGSAMGTVILGFSSAMVLGVPIGIALTHWFNWQIIFILLAMISLFILIGMIYLLPEIEGDAPVSFKQQFLILANPVILAGLFVTFFREAGGSVMYTYLTPFLATILRMNTSDIAIAMLVFGVFGAIGSRIGGYGVDKWGAVRMILYGLAAQALSLALLPLLSASFTLGIAVITIWILSMFVIAPAIQTYFIQQAPQSSNLVLSLNTSVIHLGLATGAGLGGAVVTSMSTVQYNPWVASGTILLSFVVAIVSFAVSKRKLNVNAAL
ncbi:MFS transporter [Paenibacillus sp. GCM10027628]|uniref:MFS transporter n=1 Tax=Paenibacillus sp. GCM10027628 TaxID=3273413 RepID=UPI0036259AB0